MRTLPLVTLMLMLSGCQSGDGDTTSTAGGGTSVASIDSKMLSMVEKFSQVKPWTGFNYSTQPQYLVHVDVKGAPIAGYVFNPQTALSGSQSVKGNIVRYDRDMADAVKAINSGNGKFTFDYLLDGKSYYAQVYTESDALGQNPESNGLLLSPHETFHIYQSKWSLPNGCIQDINNYPTSAVIMKDELVLNSIFAGLPKVVTDEQAKELLRQYVAIRTHQENNDNTGLVRSHGMCQERSEGTALYVETLIARDVLKGAENTTFYKAYDADPQLSSLNDIQWYFGFQVFYGSGASVTALIKQLGYKIEELEKGLYPFDVAKSLVGYDESAYDRALTTVNESDIDSKVKKYLAAKDTVKSFVSQCSNLEGDTPLTFSVSKNKSVLRVNGTICEGSYDAFMSAMKEFNSIKDIHIGQIPGSADDETNLKLSKKVREFGLNTHLFSTSMVASGGTDFFIAGTRRTAEKGAKLGVHSWALLNGSETIQGADLPENHTEHKPYLEYYEMMGIPVDFYWFTLKVAPASSMHFMSDAEINKYNVLTH